MAFSFFTYCFLAYSLTLTPDPEGDHPGIQCVKPVAKPTAKVQSLSHRVTLLVNQLSDDDFSLRTKAKRQLIELGKAHYGAVMPSCLQAYHQFKKDPEVNGALREVIYQLFLYKKTTPNPPLNSDGQVRQKFFHQSSIGLHIKPEYKDRQELIKYQLQKLSRARNVPLLPPQDILSFKADFVANEMLKDKIREGDEIIKIEALQLKDNPEAEHSLYYYIRTLPLGKDVSITYTNGKETKTVTTKVGKASELEKNFPPEKEKELSTWLQSNSSYREVMHDATKGASTSLGRALRKEIPSVEKQFEIWFRAQLKQKKSNLERNGIATD